MINGAPTKVSADRDTIHTHAKGFSDVLSWEINRHRVKVRRMSAGNVAGRY
jgi:hypothetical protein